MKKVVAFLLAFLIFVAPMTTLVKADVVVGDNDETIINENATILGRKLAMLESLSELALSGVTEYTISNTEDLDSYLDSLWSEINDAIDYLDSGEWVDDIPSNIASKYYTNLVKYRDIVNNRGEFFGFDLQNPTTSLLKTYFANDTYGKKYTSTNLYGSLDTVRALSDLNRGTPNPNPDYMSYINTINYNYGNGLDFFFNTFTIENRGLPTIGVGSQYSWVYYGSVGNTNNLVANTYYTNYMYLSTTIINANIQNVNNEYFVTISNGTPFPYKDGYGYINFRCIGNDNFIHMYPGQNSSNYINSQGYFTVSNRPFSTLEDCFKFLLAFRNINIYVDGVPWSIVSQQNNPTLDIDGYLKIYGSDNAPQYELKPNTQIDYDQLYQVIYNAIRDNLPISQGDINYYDSHDTIYSPTIINNYGDEDGDESDLIDTILDYAVIPKFDTAIAQPMRQALTNGVLIMNNSITNVIPDEILLILGACFFLLLFAVVINRMIK